MIVSRVLNRLHMMITGFPRSEKHTAQGHELVTTRGVLRSQPDYDDAWLAACAQHATKVMDIGCNVGQASVLILLGGMVQQIVLVDPNPQALAEAARNVLRNQLADVSSYVCAFVSDKTGDQIEFWTVGTGAAGSRHAGHAKTASKKGAHYPIRTVTVDDLCQTARIEPDLIKIDVEGAEADVLAGAIQCAGQKQARFFVEMHSPPDLSMTDNAGRVLTWCSNTGYSAWYLAEHKQLTAPEMIAHRGRCHLLLQPADWPFPEWLNAIEQSSPVTYNSV